MKLDNQAVRIGEILIDHGVLTPEQVQVILREQQAHGRPFGELAEHLFRVSPEAIERAWIEQYLNLGTEVDLEEQALDIEVLKTLNRRQAWQFRMLPLRHEDRELVVATTRSHLLKAVNFASRRMENPVYFLIAQRPQLEAFLMKHYPLPGVLDLPLAG